MYCDVCGFLLFLKQVALRCIIVRNKLCSNLVTKLKRSSYIFYFQKGCEDA